MLPPTMPGVVAQVAAGAKHKVTTYVSLCRVANPLHRAIGLQPMWLVDQTPCRAVLVMVPDMGKVVIFRPACPNRSSVQVMI
ncbi:hypothetical protein L6452_21998 [Arctium lappa]|uniref:Uncharacterized protein n=1 Tax=Arctium lappa TaxID=4217 RepID=A0ACB9AYY2_ARCLA|nr:hypothetical protein L6452_21998 [Arctium lappa]